MARHKGLGGSAIGALGTLLLACALFTTFLQFRPDGPDAVGVVIATACWILGFACYIIRWRD